MGKGREAHAERAFECAQMPKGLDLVTHIQGYEGNGKHPPPVFVEFRQG